MRKNTVNTFIVKKRKVQCKKKDNSPERKNCYNFLYLQDGYYLRYEFHIVIKIKI